MKKQEEEIFCNNIRVLRHQHKLKKQDMARILHIGVPSLSKLEAGEMPPRLSTEVLFFIYDYFHIRPADMFVPFASFDGE